MNFNAKNERAATKPIRLYRSKRANQLRTAVAFIGIGLIGLLPLKSFLDWFSDGPPPHPTAFWFFALVLGFPIGIVFLVNALRGVPRIIVSFDGVELETGLGAKWASWDSLEPFVIRTFRRSQTASAQVVGPNASRGVGSSFGIPDHFQTPVATIATELNAVRAHVCGVSNTPSVTAIVADEAPIGLAQFKLPLLSFALLAVLVVVFVLENAFPVAPSSEFSPSISTLFAMGGLSRSAVLSAGEWYRLFTAPLLHANVEHILGNGVALLLGGWVLERLVGRLWFLAFFVVGALGGSLLSLAVGPVGLVSVGASGALMGLFAALLVSSFHLPSGMAARHKLQFTSLRILVPSLLPLFPAEGGLHIDYGAHFGGAISGAILAPILLRFWPTTERIPQLRRTATFIAASGAILFVASAGMAAINYSKYDLVMIPDNQLPKAQIVDQAKATALVARYPRDPRSHYFLGFAMANQNFKADAEREFRTAFILAQQYSALLGPYVRNVMQATLALSLSDQGKNDEAKSLARPTCPALAGTSADNLSKLLVARHLCN